MDSDTRPEPAKRLEIARKSAGFKTAKDAADFFGWKYDTYAQHENGIRGPIRAVRQYARAFKVSDGWILTGVGPGPGEHAEAIARLTAIYRAALPQYQADLLRQAETIDLASETTRQSQVRSADPDTAAGE